MRKNLVLAVLCLAVALLFSISSKPAQAQSTIGCPSGTYDMLDWMTLDSNLRGSNHLAGNANPLYTNMGSGKFYWTKGANGTPWDIQLYDSKYIYLWITELNWNDPHTFKKFANNTNMPLVPRCAKAGFPGSVIKVPNTSYQTYSDCTHYITQTLKQGINQVWGPYNISLGGQLPTILKFWLQVIGTTAISIMPTATTKKSITWPRSMGWCSGCIIRSRAVLFRCSKKQSSIGWFRVEPLQTSRASKLLALPHSQPQGWLSYIPSVPVFATGTRCAESRK